MPVPGRGKEADSEASTNGSLPIPLNSHCIVFVWPNDCPFGKVGTVGEARSDMRNEPGRSGIEILTRISQESASLPHSHLDGGGGVNLAQNDGHASDPRYCYTSAMMEATIS